MVSIWSCWSSKVISKRFRRFFLIFWFKIEAISAQWSNKCSPSQYSSFWSSYQQNKFFCLIFSMLYVSAKRTRKNTIWVITKNLELLTPSTKATLVVAWSYHGCHVEVSGLLPTIVYWVSREPTYFNYTLSLNSEWESIDEKNLSCRRFCRIKIVTHENLIPKQRSD